MADRGTGETPGTGQVTASNLRVLFRPPHRRLTLIALIGTPVLAAACWYFGTDVAHAIAIALSITTLGLIWAAAPGGEEPAWPNDTRLDQPGRRDIAELSWWLRSRRGRVDDAALRRVRAMTSNRLTSRGLDLADPADRAAIERLIGTEAYATLRSGRQRPPLLRSVVRCLDALDTLDRRNL